jgi:hypothetical protein
MVSSGWTEHRCFEQDAVSRPLHACTHVIRRNSWISGGGATEARSGRKGRSGRDDRLRHAVMTHNSCSVAQVKKTPRGMRGTTAANTTPRGIAPRRSGRSFAPRGFDDGWFTPRTLGDGSRACETTVEADLIAAGSACGDAKVHEAMLWVADGTRTISTASTESVVPDDKRAVLDSVNQKDLSATKSNGVSPEQNGQEVRKIPPDGASKQNVSWPLFAYFLSPCIQCSLYRKHFRQ